MRISRVSLFALVVTLFVFAVPSAEAQQRCYEACSDPTTSCETECWTCQFEYPDPEPYCPQQYITYTTCGNAGFSCGQCAPNWQEVSRTKIGGEAERRWGGFGWYCRYTEWFIVTDQDMNFCNGVQYRQRCDNDEHNGNFGASQCCEYFDPADIDRTEYCGGSSC